jgi:hypothetical protein
MSVWIVLGVCIPAPIVFHAGGVHLVMETTLVERFGAQIEKLMIRVYRAFGQQCVTGLRSDRLEAVDCGAKSAQMMLLIRIQSRLRKQLSGGLNPTVATSL